MYVCSGCSLRSLNEPNVQEVTSILLAWLNSLLVAEDRQGGQALVLSPHRDSGSLEQASMPKNVKTILEGKVQIYICSVTKTAPIRTFCS
jgi:hypothetical protein